MRQWLRLLLRHKAAACGAVFMLCLLLVAMFAPVLAPYSYRQLSRDALQPPSARHLLGTDQYGRDILSRILWGARISIYVGIISVGIATALGVALGAVSGYYGGVIDAIIMRVVDAAMSMPWILLAFVIIAALGPSLTNAMIAIGIIFTPGFARVTRGSVLVVRGLAYVEAARAGGQSDLRIMLKHVLPNCFAPVVVQATMSLSFAILAEASLSFLGLGTQPPTPSWGSMLSDARNFMNRNIVMGIFPGVAIAVTVLAINLLGDGLRDVLDPRLRGK